MQAHTFLERVEEGIIYCYLEAKRATCVNYQPSCSRTTRSAAFNYGAGIKGILVLLKIALSKPASYIHWHTYSSFT
jgi:hypothetical protein